LGTEHSTWSLAATAKRRRYRRWSTDLPVRVEIDRQELYCAVGDISPRGATVRQPMVLPTRAGADIHLFLGDFGRVRGKLRWSTHEVLGVEFQLSPTARENLADWLVQNGVRRRSPRQEIDLEAVAVMADGEVPCSVTELSHAGASVRFHRPEHAAVGRDVVLVLPDHAPVRATIRHVGDNRVGIAFLEAPRRVEAA